MLVPSLLVFASITMANNTSKNPSDYQIIALKDCKIVSQTSMTQQQLNAYIPLRDAEKLIETLEVPMREMEKQLEQYTSQIEEVTELAIQEDGDSIYIDKSYLSKQKELAGKIESIVSLHQQDIDSIGEQGKALGIKAKAFEQSIKSTLHDIDHDQVRIITPGKEIHYDDCA